MRNQLDYIEIDIGAVTYKYISQAISIETLNANYGYIPCIKFSPNDLASEIKENDTVARRLKVTFLDFQTFIDEITQNKASYWRLFIARNKNYKNKIIRYYRKLEDETKQLRFSGRIENLTIAENGNVTIEAVDLLKAMSKVSYPFKTGITLARILPRYWDANSETEMLSLPAETGDSLRRKDFLPSTLTGNATSGGGTIAQGIYLLTIMAFEGIYAIGESNELQVTVSLNGSHIDLEWTAVSGATSYKIYRRMTFPISQTYLTAEVTAPTVIIELTELPTTTPEVPPAYASRWYQLTGTNPAVLGDWTYTDAGVEEVFEVPVSGLTTILPNSGYIKVDSEIINYQNKVFKLGYYYLTNLTRGLFDTDTVNHPAGTSIELIIVEETGSNGFTKLKQLLAIVGITDAYLADNFDTYETAGSVTVKTRPILKETKLSNIYFDLVNILDCLSFPNEAGLIDIVKQDEFPENIPQITEEANIIRGSSTLDLNQKSRLTRWVQYWDRLDLEKSLDDVDAYLRGNITVDNTAEIYYDDVSIETKYTTWLIAEDATELETNILYINLLLNKRRLRQRQAQNIFTCNLEIKDDVLQLGQVVQIKTSKVLTEDGQEIFNYYRVMKKEPAGNKIKFTFQTLFRYEKQTEFIEDVQLFPGKAGKILTVELIEDVELITGKAGNNSTVGFSEDVTLEVFLES